MKSITVKYLGWTNYKPIRLKASDQDGNSITVSRDSLDDGNSHSSPYIDIAKRLCLKMNWKGKLIGGHTKTGMVFVFNDPETTIEV